MPPSGGRAIASKIASILLSPRLWSSSPLGNKIVLQTTAANSLVIHVGVDSPTDTTAPPARAHCVFLLAIYV